MTDEQMEILKKAIAEIKDNMKLSREAQAEADEYKMLAEKFRENGEQGKADLAMVLYRSAMKEKREIDSWIAEDKHNIGMFFILVQKLEKLEAN